MIHSGQKYRRCTKVVYFGDHKDGQYKYNARFGRCIPLGKPIPENAIKTRFTWTDEEKSPVYVVEIIGDGYSLTNKLHLVEKDGKHRYYLVHDGQVYTTSWYNKGKV